MKTLAFGDSFVKMFIHCPNVKHLKFKGKSIKGLVKADDTERARIEREMRKTPNANRVLFIFGQVDFNYVRYYKVIKGEPPLGQETFRKYVQWVSTLNKKKNISIVSIFPSPIREEHLIFSLVNKGSYLNEERTLEMDAKLLEEYKKSHETWMTWNKWIADSCKKYKVDNLTLFKEDYVPESFRDLSNVTIHLRYVPVLRLVQKYLPIEFDEEKAQLQERKYEKEKTDRIAQSIAIFTQSIQSQKKLEEKEEAATQQSSSKTRKFSSPEDHPNYHNIKHQQPSLKNYRKKTADEEILSPQRNKPEKQILSDSQKLATKNQRNPKKSQENQKQRKKSKKQAPKKEKVTSVKKRFVQKSGPEEKKQKLNEQESGSEDEGEQFLSLSYGRRNRY